jgi:predicted DNA-binding transcriptional regulator YafY
MARKSPIETVMEILNAFAEKPSWSQAELARHLQITVRPLAKYLDAFPAHFGVYKLPPEDTKPNVVWRCEMPATVGPVISHAEVASFIKQIRRAPKSKARDAAITRLKKLSKDDRSSASTRELTPQEEMHLEQLEEAVAKHHVMHIHYVPLSGASNPWRHVSPQRIVLNGPPRVVGYCHRDLKLKWFRVDRIYSALADVAVKYVQVAREQVDAHCDNSVDGFNSGLISESAESFTLEPAARWAAVNLPSGLRATDIGQGHTRVTVPSSGIIVAARFVVGLGAEAHVETPALRRLVHDLACASLTRAEAPLPVERPKKLASSPPRQEA